MEIGLKSLRRVISDLYKYEQCDRCEENFICELETIRQKVFGLRFFSETIRENDPMAAGLSEIERDIEALVKSYAVSCEVIPVERSQKKLFEGEIMAIEWT